MRRPWMTGLVILLFLITTHHVLRAQGTSKETSANVPALTEFHKVIYKIWHTAWPNKDYRHALGSSTGGREGNGRDRRAELPGILRDKKVPWEKGVEESEEHC